MKQRTENFIGIVIIVLNIALGWCLAVMFSK